MNRKIPVLVGRRALQMVPIAIFATFIIFALLHLVPDDPALILAGEQATRERIEEIRQLYGFDRPMVVQYADWLWSAVRGDLGISMLSSESVWRSILQRLPNTMMLVVYSIVISVCVGVPLGVFAAIHRGSRLDSFVTGFASLGVAVPSFWLAILLVVFFSLELRWFPSTGAAPFTSDPLEAIRHATLPAIALSLGNVAELARQVRSALLEVLDSQYVRTLWAKGLGPGRILWKHAMRNIAVTILTVIGLMVGSSFSGSVVVETIFAYPGVGSLAAYSAVNKDFPTIQGVILVMVMLVLITNLVVDVVNIVLDPRVAEE